MDRSLRFTLLVAVLALAGAASAMQAASPCKNHFILDEPCTPGWAAVSNGLADLDVQVVAVDPVDRGTLYAGGPSGVFKSVDGGGSWRPTALALAPQNVVVGQGRSSAHLTLSSRVSHLAIDPTDTRIVYASTTRDAGCVFWQQRLFRSVDGGTSWDGNASPAINGCDNIHSLELGAGSPAALYVTDYDDATGDSWSPLLRSTDAAITWDYLGYPAVNVLAVDPSDPLTLYAGSFDFPPSFTTLRNGVLKSVDAGATWSATGLVGTGISALALDRNRAGAIYAAAVHGLNTAEWAFAGLFKSTDGGVSWSPTGLDCEASARPCSAVVSLIVDPADSDVVYVAMSRGGVWRSGDAGASWRPVADGLANVFIRSLAMAPGKPTTLYAATSSGVFTITQP